MVPSNSTGVSQFKDTSDFFDVEDGADTVFKEKLVETDEGRLRLRRKQIAYGKNTLGYQQYIMKVPKEKRRVKYGKVQIDPVTPDIHRVCSKRQWEGQVRAWRKSLHDWDPEGFEGEEYVELPSINPKAPKLEAKALTAPSEPLQPRSALPEQGRKRTAEETTEDEVPEAKRRSVSKPERPAELKMKWATTLEEEADVHGTQGMKVETKPSIFDDWADDEIEL